mmetsp:Transcript_356/g.766  ORF Transcript_356/g.766 Transcript_356/m.766 type:complete len:231 (-) Transcript_356:37-729(-)
MLDRLFVAAQVIGETRVALNREAVSTSLVRGDDARVSRRHLAAKNLLSSSCEHGDVDEVLHDIQRAKVEVACVVHVPVRAHCDDACASWSSPRNALECGVLFWNDVDLFVVFCAVDDGYHESLKFVNHLHSLHKFSRQARPFSESVNFLLLFLVFGSTFLGDFVQHIFQYGIVLEVLPVELPDGRVQVRRCVLEERLVALRRRQVQVNFILGEQTMAMRRWWRRFLPNFL